MMRVLKNRKYAQITLLGLVIALGLLPPALRAQEVTQGYNSDKPLLRGSIVALDPKDSNKVQAINQDRIDDLFGVVVRSNDTAINITDDASGVFVATQGRFEMLVSDINGQIKNGDILTASSLTGIAMKADTNQRLKVGKALQDFEVSNNTNVLSRTTVRDNTGKEVTVAIGRVLVEIEVGRNPLADETSRVPKFLQLLADQVADKPVSPLRIYAGATILLIIGAIVGSLLYSAVRNGLVAIGRNPLSRRSVLAGLAQVIITSLVIFMGGIFAVYLVLKS